MSSVHRRVVVHPGDPKSELPWFQRDWQTLEILSVEWCCRQAEQELCKMYEGTIGITRPCYGDVTEDAVSFCPWCGKKIEYVEEAPIRLVPVPRRKTVKTYDYREEPL
jgi:hypothetical protein